MGKRKLVYGVGINDYYTNVKKNGIVLLSYAKWKSLLQRCYSSKWKTLHPSYKDCVVCDEWLYFSNFNDWFVNNYVAGYDLDKDILVRGNKVYSPNTCCFVPHEINVLIREYNIKGKELPIGVSYDKIRNKYKAGGYFLSISKRFNTAEEALSYYTQAKVNYIHKLAKEYYQSNKISEIVYKALLNFKCYNYER